MLKKFLAAGALSLLAIGASSAQTPLMNWDQPTRDSFFTDGKTLKSASEVQMSWSMLSAAQKEQIRSDCQHVQMSADTNKTPGTAQDPDAATGSDPSTTSSTNEGGRTDAGPATPGDAPDVASLTEFCGMVGSMQ